MKNTKFKAIIVDDEARGISALRQLIEKYVPDVYVVAGCTNPIEAIPIIDQQKPDIVFLDIDMPDMNGFEMLDKLNLRNFSLIFTTAHEEYGLQALKKNAIDYLLKPVSRIELIEAIARVKEKREANTLTVNFSELFESLSQSSRAKLTIHHASGIETWFLEQILILESKSNYTRIVKEDKSELITRKTLKEFETQLCVPGSDFIRVQKSYIINLRKVTRFVKLTEEIILTSGIKITLSKTRREAFLIWLKNLRS